MRKELIDLNKSFAENKAKMKETSDEMKAMEKEQKSLDAAIKSGTATAEQKTRYKDLSSKIEEARLKMAQFKTVEQDLKSKTSAATSELKKMNTGMRDTKSSTDTAKNSLSGLATSLKALAMGYTGKKLYDWLIGSNADMEQYITSFTVMLGSAEKAQSMIQSMTNFAAKTPLELTDVVSTGQLLMNYGVSAENLIPTMQKLGDLAGGNADKLNRVALAYGQMLAKGKVSGEELRQMTEAGVPLLQTLADTMGKTTAEVQELTSKGSVGISDLNNAITSLTTGSGKFAGMMEQQSQTMNGMLSTMKDNFDQFGRDVGEGAFQEVKGALQEVMDMIQKASEDGTIDKIASDAGNLLSGTLKILLALIKAGYDCKEIILISVLAVKTYDAAIYLHTNHINLLAIKTNFLTIKQKALNLAMSANPAAILAAAIAAWALAVGNAIYQVVTYKSEMDKLNQTMQEADEEAKNQTASLRLQYERYEELREKVNRTAEEENELKYVASELQKTLGDGVQVINSQTGAFNDLKQSVDDYIKSAEVAAKINYLQNSYDEAVSNIESAREKLSELENKFKKYGAGTTVFGGSLDELEKQKEKIRAYEDIITKYNDLKKQEFNSETQSSNQKQEEKEEVIDLVSAYESATNAADLYNSAQKEANNTGTLSITTLQKMLALYPQQTEQYKKMNDAVNKYLEGQLNEKQVVNELAKCYKIDSNNYYNTVSTKMKNDSSYYNAVLKNNATMVNKFKEKYGIDLANYANYTDAKKAIDRNYSSYAAAMQNLSPSERGRVIKQYGSWDAYVNHLNKKYVTTGKYAQSDFNKLFSGVSASSIKLSSPSLGTVSTSGTSSGSKNSSASASVSAEISIYEKANEAYKKLVQDRIDAINAEKDAKKEALDASLNAIDKEIEARKRLNEDADIQKEIDAINAQLKYAQLDDFSRMEMEKKKQSLLDDQAETAWQRAQSDKKESLQSSYDAAVANSNDMIDQLQSAMSYANDLFSSLKAGSQTVSSIVNNNSKSANVSIVNQALTAGQIAKAVRDLLWDGV